MIGGLKDEWTHGMLRSFSGVKAKKTKGVEVGTFSRLLANFNSLLCLMGLSRSGGDRKSQEPALIIVESGALIMR